ncbi:UNVERIFIED_CONTAM: hypothetical protein FKN15_070812 [Acipenser sinensis]
MLTLASKLKRDDAVKSGHSNSATTDSARRVSIRDRLLVKGIPIAEQCHPFQVLLLTVQPPQGYSVGGQRSSGQLTGKPAGARPDYRGRWCAVSRGHPGRPNPPSPRATLGQLSAASWKLPSTVGCGIAWTRTRDVQAIERILHSKVAELEANLPNTCKVNFPDVNKLHHFQLDVTPDEGYYQSGKFQFEVDVPEAYNMAPPKVKCLTRIWHPNITETGEICLSLLREHSIDCTGWAPTRTLKDVVWGLNSLFTDLLNFDDPLNIEAAEHHLRDKVSFSCT